MTFEELEALPKGTRVTGVVVWHGGRETQEEGEFIGVFAHADGSEEAFIKAPDGDGALGIEDIDTIEVVE